MKAERLLIIFALIFLVVPFAHAKIYIASGFRQAYNFQDQLNLGGYIISDFQIDGTFRVVLACGSQQAELFRSKIQLPAKGKVLFSDLGLVEVSIPTTVTGTCAFQFIVSSANADIETVISPPFTVTRELQGTFWIKDNQLQLGEHFIMQGTVYKLSGENVEGTARISVSNNSRLVSLATVTLKDGKVSIDKQITQMKSGVYNLIVDVTSDDSNNYQITNITTLTILTNISIAVDMDRTSALPGEEFFFKGTARHERPSTLDGETIKVKLGTAENTFTITDNFFEGSINVPKQMPAGTHAIVFTIQDKQGNFGTSTIDVTVAQKEERLFHELNAVVFLPGENMTVKPVLYDQANKIISLPVALELWGPDKKLIFRQDVPPGNAVSYSFFATATPGQYTLLSSSKHLQKKDVLKVESVESLSSSYEEGLIIIKNVGNVPVKRAMGIGVSDGKQKETLYPQVKLAPNQTTSLNLSSMLPTGTYAINLGDGNGTIYLFNNSEDGRSTLQKLGDGLKGITGFSTIRVRGTATTLVVFFVGILAIITLLVINFLFGKERRWDKYHEQKEQQQFLDDLSTHKGDSFHIIKAKDDEEVPEVKEGTASEGLHKP
ncbi:hypothetical protein HZB01_02235 [Candidatus Woesearchaeota archaeon]|nr:hypothetical protein [Candidatus Woesearchaeota archaeon]